MVLFIMLYMVALTFESIDGISKCDYFDQFALASLYLVRPYIIATLENARRKLWSILFMKWLLLQNESLTCCCSISQARVGYAMIDSQRGA